MAAVCVGVGQLSVRSWPSGCRRAAVLFFPSFLLGSSGAQPWAVLISNLIALLRSQILSNRFVFSLAVPVMVSASSTHHVAIKS